MLRQRKNIDDLPTAALEDLKHAFRILQSRPVSDKTSYAYQVLVHAQAPQGPCEHVSDLIWPWHRAFLFYFEQLLQQADPPRTQNVTLPYWDWTLPPSYRDPGGLPTGYPSAYEDPASPLFHADRNRYRDGLPAFADSDAQDLLRLSTWAQFGGRPKGEVGSVGHLEFQPHNAIHSIYINGSMGHPPTAVRDPIFWAHHANLDRLWDQWFKKWGESPIRLDRKLRGFPADATVGKFLKVEDSGYEYLERPAPLPLASVPHAGVHDRERTFRFGPASELGVPTPEEGRVRLQIADLKIPQRAYVVQIFVYPVQESFRPDVPEFVARYFATYFVVWSGHGDHTEHGGHGGHDHGGEGESDPTAITYQITLTRAFKRLRKWYPDQEARVSLSFLRPESRDKSTVIPFGGDVQFGATSLLIDEPDGGSSVREVDAL